MVILTHVGNQIFNARMMVNNLKVGVKVEKGEEDGLFKRDSVYKVVKAVVDENNEVGKEVRENHSKNKEMLLKQDLESSYVDNVIEKLQELKGLYWESKVHTCSFVLFYFQVLFFCKSF